jgi:glycosyltransferase involved in cell wall biosynthesis
VIRKHADAHLLVAGGDFENTAAAAKLITSEQCLHDVVTFSGVLNGNTKLSALSISSVFCLPSYGEGMSVSVLEALSIGLPVVITPECNVDKIRESGAGLLTSNRPAELADALIQSLSLTGSQWQVASAAARSLARQYDWERIGASMQSVYEWLLGGPRPDCVVSH